MGAGLSHAVCVYRCTKAGLVAGPQMCHHKWWLPMKEHEKEEEPRDPVGDPRRGGFGSLLAIPLHRAGKFNMFIILFKTKMYPLQLL